MNGYRQKEDEGRAKYNRNRLLIAGNKRYRFTQYEYEKYDVVFDTIDRVDEIKNRDISAGKYIDEGFILEKIKYDELITHNEAYYVNFFKDDTIIIWDIKEMPEPCWITKNCTASTVNYGERRIDKDCCLLSYDNACIVAYKGKILTDEQRKRYIPYLRQEWEKEQERERQSKQELIRELFTKIKEEKDMEG